jgi:hypothetical protein
MRRTNRSSRVSVALTALGLTVLASQTSCLEAPDGRSIEGMAGGDWGTGGFYGTGGETSAGGTYSTGGSTSTGGITGGGTGGFVSTGGSSPSGGTGGGTAGTGGFVATGGSATGGSGGYISNPCIYFPYTTSYGYACGANLSTQADPSRLYLCNGTTTTGSVHCPSGCYAAPVGQADYCYGTDPCINNPFDGEACGANLAPYANQKLLYNCSGQRTIGSKDCGVNGCHASPPGQADYCN